MNNYIFFYHMYVLYYVLCVHNFIYKLGKNIKILTFLYFIYILNIYNIHKMDMLKIMFNIFYVDLMIIFYQYFYHLFVLSLCLGLAEWRISLIIIFIIFVCYLQIDMGLFYLLLNLKYFRYFQMKLIVKFNDTFILFLI